MQFRLLQCILKGSLRHLSRCIGGGVYFPALASDVWYGGRAATVAKGKECVVRNRVSATHPKMSRGKKEKT